MTGSTARGADVPGVALTEELGRPLERPLWEWLLYRFVDDLDATNGRAEQAIRPAVVNRKLWGGHRTTADARVQPILTSVLVAAAQHARNALDFLSRTLRGQQPQLIPASGR